MYEAGVCPVLLYVLRKTRYVMANALSLSLSPVYSLFFFFSQCLSLPA
jgi:hypothetical protein